MSLAYSDEFFMKEAMKEAQKAFIEEEIPIGAVIVCQNKIIARSFNYTERLTDVTAHAEMQAFTSAANHLNGKYLTDCILYVTLEPCVMCAGASYWTRISKIVYGAKDEKRGFSKYSNKIIHPTTIVIGGVLEKECAEILRTFFLKKRNNL
ncbi:MAG TPA: nucleoside deaminase [Bacteroidales bacterium]|nr:nucleoside deaminase [Bacteroidales bacterium]HQH18464.1 nucleoside deaminase [Bacteroidales bacterium]HQI45841.1 nucleoside deaminase [Bacteroidales bacterium]